MAVVITLNSIFLPNYKKYHDEYLETLEKYTTNDLSAEKSEVLKRRVKFLFESTFGCGYYRDQETEYSLAFVLGRENYHNLEKLYKENKLIPILTRGVTEEIFQEWCRKMTLSDKRFFVKSSADLKKIKRQFENKTSAFTNLIRTSMNKKEILEWRYGIDTAY